MYDGEIYIVSQKRYRYIPPILYRYIIMTPTAHICRERTSTLRKIAYNSYYKNIMEVNERSCVL